MANRAAWAGVKGEGLSTPITADAQATVLLSNATSGAAYPVPHTFQELLSAQVMAR